jgi:ABC-type protease/lipase transport system fused ATPase/permease subunit
MNDLTQPQHNTWGVIRKALFVSALGIISLSTLINFTLLAVPLYSLQIFDRVLNSKSEETLWMLCTVTLVVCLMGIALDTVRRRIPRILSHLIQDRVQQLNLEDWALNSLSPSKKSDKSQSSPGVLLKLSHLLSQPSLQGLADALFIPVFLLVMFWMHPLLGVAMLVVNGLLIAITVARHFTLKRLQPNLSQTAQTTQRECQALQQEYSNALIMGYHHLWLARVKRAVDHQTQGLSQSDTTQQSLMSMSYSLRTLSQIAVPTVGAMLLIQQQITAGQLLAAIIIASRCLMPFDQLIGHWRELIELRQILQQIKTLLGNVQDDKYRPTATLNGSLRVVGNASQHTRPIDIRINKGEHVAIIGPSGSGKSCLLNAILGISAKNRTLNNGIAESTPDLTVYLDGFQSHHLDRRWLHNQIGYATSPSAPLTLSIKDYISHLQTSTSNRIERAAQQAGIHDDILTLSAGYDSIITDEPKACSKSFMQKLAIARALFFQPKYLFLDEVDNLLDNDGLNTLQQLFQEMQNRGTTVISVTQRKSIIESSDKILLMDNGSPAFFGPPQGLSLTNNRVHPIHSLHTLRGESS